MTTYNLYKYRESGLGFVIKDGDENNSGDKYSEDLTRSLDNGEIEFEEVFNSKEELDKYIKEKSIKLSDSSKIGLS
jgi:hypothetical protein